MSGSLGADMRVWEAAKRSDMSEVARLLDQGTPADPVAALRPTRKEQFKAFAAEYGFGPEQLDEHRELIEQEMDAALASGTWGAPEPAPESALCVAVHRAAFPMIMKLLSAGADANRSHGKLGRTPFHDVVDAAVEGTAHSALQPIVFSLVMAGGAPSQIPHVDSVWLKGSALPLTPVQYARKHGQPMLADVMEAAAARSTRDQRNTAAQLEREAEKRAAAEAATQTFDARTALLSPTRVEQVGRRLAGGQMPTPVYTVGREPTFTPFGLEHAKRDGPPARASATLLGTFDDTRNSPTLNLQDESPKDYGRGRARGLEDSTARCKLVASRAEKEGKHPAAADSRWAPDEGTRQELRAELAHPQYGSQVRHLLPVEVELEEVNTIGERQRRIFPTLAVQEQGSLQRNSLVSGE
jgi:hypothetical protein